MKSLKDTILKKCICFIFVVGLLLSDGCSRESLVLKERDADFAVDDSYSSEDIDKMVNADIEAADKAESSSKGDADIENISEAELPKVTVFVCGAVKNEGVYELPDGARVDDALAASGGFVEGADTAAVNRADILYDGQQIYFPYEGEQYDFNYTVQEDNDLVDINHADKETLMTLSGIGESKAESIIEYRETIGSFENKEDIKNVSGIGDSIYLKIEEYITVGR